MFSLCFFKFDVLPELWLFFQMHKVGHCQINKSQFYCPNSGSGCITLDSEISGYRYDKSSHKHAEVEAEASEGDKTTWVDHKSLFSNSK